MAEGEHVPLPTGVSGEVERPHERRLPYERVAEVVGLSAHRLRRLLNTGRVEGKKVRKRGKGYPWRWVTSFKAVERYKTSLKTPREYGLLGGRPRRRKAAGTA